jgi:hypothetical protein
MKSSHPVSEGLNDRIRRAHRRAIAQIKAEALRRLGRSPTKNPMIISAIKNKELLSFTYNGVTRLVEPQTYGLSIAGHEVLRARQVAGGSSSGQDRIAKLFDLDKISQLKRKRIHFDEALPEHNPQDSAMIEVFASLPRPKRRLSKKQQAEGATP